ncbi:uncharacterized protein LOC113233501, partial [Hyposmocoma kahamanoa]|uniref:uncharacterized protein LOC113233501 n=1 Tax=Hyposmocoma kahamanoa TaxID=1477025 RepID=UPI000E6D641C
DTNLRVHVKKTPFAADLQFQNKSLNSSESIGTLDVDTSCDIQFLRHLDGKVKLASKKLGMIYTAKRYFTSEQRVLLYKSLVRPHMEYYCHLWAGVPECQLERCATRIVDDPVLAYRR